MRLTFFCEILIEVLLLSCLFLELFALKSFFEEIDIASLFIVVEVLCFVLLDNDDKGFLKFDIKLNSKLFSSKQSSQKSFNYHIKYR